MSSFSFGQLMMIGVSGHTLTHEEKKFIVDNDICGITLFGRNCSSPQQIRDLCAEIQSLRHQTASKKPFFIGIDMEGGRVARLKSPFTVWPAMSYLGKIDSPNLSFQFAQALGTELRAVGINLDYAPCADILTNPSNPVIGDRSFSSDPEIVAKHVSAVIRGFVKSEVISCAKHFPGHGNTNVDSHLDLPIEDTDLATLDSREFIPFQRAIKSKVDMVMSAHIRFPNIDPDWPATLSEIFLKQYLRGKLRFDGVTVTDDLGMKAMSNFFPSDLIPVRALQAGVDLLLYCNEFEIPPMALEALKKAHKDKKLKEDELLTSLKRINALKEEYLKMPDPLPFDQIKDKIGHNDHYRISIEMKDVCT